ncbi:MoaB/Mog domain-containing protein [Lasiosphaeris hirsuta]|uniref:MoaB/Mog domain-containing protein n=1 Tax=Lasiosphaeris hirsuta TaxID=260670 RepID=A0AA40AHE0_9PEZI|nr:MoaB/Mog domain-containing protein [Lasiosphaeris hirsuta]
MSSKPNLTAAVLIVSTTAAKDPSTDAANVALRNVFDQSGGGQWTVTESKIVSDVTTQIQRQITHWADAAEPVNLIVTTGGTGFAIADHTPEAISVLLHKQAPGLVHGMLAASLAVTPFAMMSRPVAGVRNRTVIITLPGSPKGAKENLEAVFKTLPHACLQAAGANSRALHSGGVKKLEQDAGVAASDHAKPHSHDHHHNHSHHHHDGHNHGSLVRHTQPSENPKSNDPTLGPSRRHRESPFPMLSVADALALITQHTPRPTAVPARIDSGLVGAVLAQDVAAREDVPAFRASIVDGYAVVVPADGNLRGVFPVTAVSHAAPEGEDAAAATLVEGQVARITTGAPLPPGATSVIMVEDTVLVSGTEDGREEREVEILAGGVVREGENVREVGSDIREGTVILAKGDQVSAVGGEIGLLAAVGVAEVQVYRRPLVGVLSTGDEIVEADRPGALRLGEVRDTNRPTLISAARGWGYEVVDLGIASDQPGSLEEVLRQALRQVDLVITTGGVSMGELDLLKPTIERTLGGTIHFGRVAMKPGKPATFATVPAKNNAGERVEKVVFSLPGNPASALVTFHLFVLPSLHQMSGVSPPGLTRVPVVLAHDFRLDKSRPEYHRAVVSVTADGLLSAASTGGQRSSTVGSMKGANALLCLPSGSEQLRKGAKVDALLMGNIRNDDA